MTGTVTRADPVRQAEPGPGDRTDSGPGWPTALSVFATGVTLVTVADGRDDVGTTVSAFCPVSLDTAAGRWSR